MVGVDKIYNIDCLKGMEKLPNRSVDLIIMDPPYNIHKADWDTFKTVGDYVLWMTEVFKSCNRVLKRSGALYWFHNDFKQIRQLMDSIDKHTDFIFQQFITWNKIDESYNNYSYFQQRLSIRSMKNYYNGFTEYILFYTFQDKTGDDYNDCFLPIKSYLRAEKKKIIRDKKLSNKQFNGWINNITGTNSVASRHYFSDSQWSFPTQEIYAKMRATGYFQKPYVELKQLYDRLKYIFNTAYAKGDIRANSNVWIYPPAPKAGHITPKPVELIKNIISHSSNPGQLILDPFAGSGSIAIAALDTGRHFVGFEIDKDYYYLSNRRISNHTEQLRIGAR